MIERILIVPDCHHPFVDKRAWSLVLKVGRDFKPHTVVTLGDFADFYSVSSHDKDPRRERSLEKEVSHVHGALRELTALRPKRLIYVAGNHEDRLERYLMQKAPELFESVSIPSVLGLDDIPCRVEYVPYKDHTRIGKIYVTHDTGTAGPTAHSKALNDFQDNIIIGHTHRLGYEVRGNARGVAHIAAMFGWLGDTKQVDYMHTIKANRDWALGFGVAYHDTKTDLCYIQPVPIVKYTCMVAGKIYK